jgi:predicted RNA-binding protein Jag
MIDWFLNLDKAAQAALASSVASAVVIGIVAVLGFWITFKTSIAANERIAAVAKQNNFLQLQFSADSKIAEMRQKWIDDLREHLAEYAAEATTEMMLLQFGHQPSKGRGQYLYNYLVLKLNPAEEKHKKIIELLGKMSATNNALKSKLQTISEEEKKKAIQYFQKLFDELGVVATSVFKEEWIRVKSEIRSATAS